MKFSQMRISRQLAVGFGLILVLVLSMGVIGYQQLQSISKYIDYTLETTGRFAEHTARARANITAMRQYEKDVFINIRDAKKVDSYTKEWQEEYKATMKRIQFLQKLKNSEKYKDTLDKLFKNVEEYKAGFLSILEEIKEGNVTDTAEANILMGKFKKAVHASVDISKEAATTGNKNLQLMEGEVHKEVISLMQALASIIIAVLIFAVFISLFISRAIGLQLKNLIEQSNQSAEHIAKGDLTVSIEEKNVGIDFKQIPQSINNMVDIMKRLISSFVTSVDIITSSSRGISTSSQSLSQGTNEQASSTEEISSAIGELAAQTKQASDNAINTQKISSEAMAAANSGEAKMNQMVEAMEEISVSSRNIAKIMKTIDEIAFQTNLLALNAAVEAARAGRHGKGFAVVAEEVNNLSKRSSRAAKETADIIEGSIKKIEVGKNITEAAQDTFQKIFSKISEVASLSAEIAKASEEQVKGIDQVERGIRQIDQVTQQNASIAEENASASETLTSQAIQLKDMVDKFVLDKGNGHGRAKISQNQGLLGGHSLREGDASKPVFHAQELKKPINPVRTVSP